MKKIVLCGGGTAGHIIPCIALIPELKKLFDEIIYIGSKNGMEKELVEKENIPFFSIESIKFDRTKLFKNIKIPFLLPKYVKQAVSLLQSIKPDVIFSKGGYVSLPVTLGAKKLGIPYVIHESDITMGLSNKLASKGAKLIMTNFDINKGKNCKKVGIPLKSNVFSPKNSTDILKNLNLPNRKTILVTGGSLGAKSLNKATYESIPTLCKKYNVIHLSGKNDNTKLNAFGYLKIPFTNNMGELYKVSDVVVSRGGATTLCELETLSKKAIIVPLSQKTSRGDQVKNAIEYSKKENFKMILDENLSSKILIDSIEELLNKKTIDNNKKTLPNEEISNILFDIALGNS